MKIIRRPKRTKKYRGTCQHCGTRIETEAKDKIRHVEDRPGDGGHCVTCPNCKNHFPVGNMTKAQTVAEDTECMEWLQNNWEDFVKLVASGKGVWSFHAFDKQTGQAKGSFYDLRTAIDEQRKP